MRYKKFDKIQHLFMILKNHFRKLEREENSLNLTKRSKAYSKPHPQ